MLVYRHRKRYSNGVLAGLNSAICGLAGRIIAWTVCHLACSSNEPEPPGSTANQNQGSEIAVPMRIPTLRLAGKVVISQLGYIWAAILSWVFDIRHGGRRTAQSDLFRAH